MHARRRICDVCPLLLPSSPLGRCFRGYISVDGQDFAVCLTLPPTGELKDARFECDWMVSQILKGKESLLQKLLQESEDVASFLLKLRHILNHHTHPAILPPPPPPPDHYNQLLADLEIIGWWRVIHISSDFTQLKISTQDEKQREHIFTVHLSQCNLEASPTITCDLPLPFKPTWSSGKTTLYEVVKSFEDHLSVYQLIWDVMDELDRETWVLEPQQPTRSCNYRRIVVCSNVSLYLTVNIYKPSSVPEFKILGPEHVVDPIRHKMLARVSQWDSSVQMSLKQNLEKLLDLKLPGPQTSQQEVFCEDCVICYAYQLQGVVPDVMCDHCNKPFHFDCILEWLQTLSSTRQSFGTLFGECPYCNEQVSIKLRR